MNLTIASPPQPSTGSAVATLGSNKDAPTGERRALRELRAVFADYLEGANRHAQRAELEGRSAEASAWRERVDCWSQAIREVAAVERLCR